MPIPNLLHPVSVTVQCYTSSDTLFDADAREPTKQATRKATVTLPAQVLWAGKDGTEKSRLGLQDTDVGYVLFRKVEMDAISYRPQRRDRITTIGTLTGMQLFITGVIPRAHYPSAGGFTLWQCNFTDRAPVVSNG